MSLFFAMGMFALTMSISPGPVNMITLSAGVNYGMRRTMPFVCGAAIGFTLLLATVGLGVSQLVERTPIFLNVLSFLGAILIAYMGYRIATAKPSHDTQVHEAPVFAQGFLLQWLNPKAWIASLTGVSAFGLADSRGMLIAFCTMYLVVCFASIATWAYIGSRLTEILENDARLAKFNTLMGAALILVAIFLFYLQLKGTGAVTTG